MLWPLGPIFRDAGGCDVEIVPWQLYLSIALVLGIWKIGSTRSSDGLSPWYLLLGAVSSFSNLANIIVLQAPIFKCCAQLVEFMACLGCCKHFHKSPCFIACSFYNISFRKPITGKIFLRRFALFFIYFPVDKKYHTDERSGRTSKTRDWKHSLRALKITIFYVLAMSIISAVVIVWGMSTSPLVTATWTTLLAAIALVASSVQFIPQILRTYQLKLVGALSIPAMLMQTPGSFLFCVTIASSPGTNITSWITYFVGGCLQGTLLILCIYYHNYPPPTEIGYVHVNFDEGAKTHHEDTAIVPPLGAIEATTESFLLGNSDSSDE